MLLVDRDVSFNLGTVSVCLIRTRVLSSSATSRWYTAGTALWNSSKKTSPREAKFLFDSRIISAEIPAFFSSKGLKKSNYKLSTDRSEHNGDTQQLVAGCTQRRVVFQGT